MKAIHESLENFDLKKLVDEIIVIHARDDETTPFEK